MARGNVLVGISGWSYAPWRGNFIPNGLPQKLELAFAARRFGALEVNGTFYSLQRPSTFTSWYNQTPPGFVFALKGGRFITHMRKLREPLPSLANFFASGPLCLREKLGPILWQFPPQFHFNADRFRAFFDLLPRDTIEVARLARKYDDRIKGRVFLDSDVLHGSRRLYVSGYTPREIEAWARRIETWREGEEPEDIRRIAKTLRNIAPRAEEGSENAPIQAEDSHA